MSCAVRGDARGEGCDRLSGSPVFRAAEGQPAFRSRAAGRAHGAWNHPNRPSSYEHAVEIGTAAGRLEDVSCVNWHSALAVRALIGSGSGQVVDHVAGRVALWASRQRGNQVSDGPVICAAGGATDPSLDVGNPPFSTSVYTHSAPSGEAPIRLWNACSSNVGVRARRF